MAKVLFGVTVAMTAQAFLRQQLVEMLGCGWEVHLACSPSDGTDAWSLIEEIPGLRLHPISMSREPRLFRDLKSLYQWIQLIRNVRPDVVVASTPKAGLLATLASRMGGVRHRVYHIRGLRAEGLSGPIAYINQFAERIATLTATDVLVDSPSLRQALLDRRLMGANQGVVLGGGSCCGVDIEWFRPPSSSERVEARTQLGLIKDSVVVGYVGRLHPDKGVLDLIKAVERARLTNPQLLLVLVGAEDETAKARIDFDQFRMIDWIKFTGPRSDTRTFYWAFDLFASPSYREGFPIAPLEAQACGLPVITTHATGCRDAVEDLVTGITIPPGNQPALAEAIVELTSNVDQRRIMAQAARQRTTALFDSREVRRRHIDFIAALIENRAT